MRKGQFRYYLCRSFGVFKGVGNVRIKYLINITTKEGVKMFVVILV